MTVEISKIKAMLLKLQYNHDLQGFPLNDVKRKSRFCREISFKFATICLKSEKPALETLKTFWSYFRGFQNVGVSITFLHCVITVLLHRFCANSANKRATGVNLVFNTKKINEIPADFHTYPDL